jgi:ribose transport system substrate-binding protein
MRRSMLLLAMACTSTLLLPLAACGTNGSGSSGDGTKKFRVDFANYTEAATLFRVIHTNLDTIIGQHNAPVNLKWFDNNSDPATMLRNAQLMINDRPDAIVMYPVSNATEGISALIERSKIPCVSLNLDTKSCDFLNINNAALGEDTAKIIGQIANQRGWNASNTTERFSSRLDFVVL